MTISLGDNGCSAPCTTCAGPCDTCADTSSTMSVVMTLPDVTTITPLGGSCPDCDTYQDPTELVAMNTQADANLALDTFASYGCYPAANMTADTACGFVTEESCAGFYRQRYAITYRTDSGDLRMFVGIIQGWSDGLCSGTKVASDDFELASGSYQFDCLTLDHDGSLTPCSGSDPACSCTFPGLYNVKMMVAS